MSVTYIVDSIGSNSNAFVSLQEALDQISSSESNNITIKILESLKLENSSITLHNPELTLNIVGDGEKNGSHRPVIKLPTEPNSIALSIDGEFKNLTIDNLKFNNKDSFGATAISISPFVDVDKVAIKNCRIIHAKHGIILSGAGKIHNTNLFTNFILNLRGAGATALKANNSHRVKINKHFIVYVGDQEDDVTSKGIQIGSEVNFFLCRDSTIFGVWGDCVHTSAANNSIANVVLDVGRVSGLKIESSTLPEGESIVEKSYIATAGNLPSNMKGNDPVSSSGSASIHSLSRKIQLVKLYSNKRRPGSNSPEDSHFIFHQINNSEMEEMQNEWKGNLYLANIVPDSLVNETGVWLISDSGQQDPVPQSNQYTFSQSETPRQGEMHKRFNDALGEMRGVIKDDAWKSASPIKVQAHRTRCLEELWSAPFKTPYTDALDAKAI